MILKSFKHSLSAMALAAAGLTVASAAHAVVFEFKDIGTTPMSAAQLGAFQAAGDYWSSKLKDNATVYLHISFSDLGPSEFRLTDSSYVTANYSTVRSALVADAKGSTDATAVANLQAGPALSFRATQGDLTSRLDNDGSTNNVLVGITTANAKAKAMGLATNTNSFNPDGRVGFNTRFANNFAYARNANGQVQASQYDFITLAEREIGHVLGFNSGVDDIDFCVGAANVCGLPNTVGRFENDWWYQPLDLFRFSAPGQMDVRVGGSPYLSIDGGVTDITAFSTGTRFGSGYRASYFGVDEVNLMRPFSVMGQSYDASARDLLAFDAIGWDLAPVPEPGTYALMVLGLCTVVGAARRRRQVAVRDVRPASRPVTRPAAVGNRPSIPRGLRA